MLSSTHSTLGNVKNNIRLDPSGLRYNRDTCLMTHQDFMWLLL